MPIADWETAFFLVTIPFYALAAVLYFFAPRQGAVRLRRLAASGGVACHALTVALRATQTWRLDRRLPLSSQFELTVLVVLFVVIAFLALGRHKVFEYLGAYVMPLAAAAMLYAAYLPREIRPLSESLRTYWLKVHVSSAVLAYAAFLLAAATGVMYLVQERRSRDERQLAAIDALTYRIVLAGFPFMTVLLLSGILWAKVAWNRYWGWDPKEIWASLTWLAYAVLLFGRRYLDWKPRLASWMVLFGFASVMVTYVGVRYLNSIHSY